MLVVPTAERTANVNPCTLSLVFPTIELKRNVLLWRVRAHLFSSSIRSSITSGKRVPSGVERVDKTRLRFSVANRLADFHAISYLYERN